MLITCRVSIKIKKDDIDDIIFFIVLEYTILLIKQTLS